jgi:hypothetical protein
MCCQFIEDGPAVRIPCPPAARPIVAPRIWELKAGFGPARGTARKGRPLSCREALGQKARADAQTTSGGSASLSPRDRPGHARQEKREDQLPSAAPAYEIEARLLASTRLPQVDLRVVAQILDDPPQRWSSGTGSTSSRNHCPGDAQDADPDRIPIARGTEGSKPSPSRGESDANLAQTV